jgi:hypothetical protein
MIVRVRTQVVGRNAPRDGTGHGPRAANSRRRGTPHYSVWRPLQELWIRSFDVWANQHAPIELVLDLQAEEAAPRASALGLLKHAAISAHATRPPLPVLEPTMFDPMIDFCRDRKLEQPIRQGPNAVVDGACAGTPPTPGATLAGSSRRIEIHWCTEVQLPGRRRDSGAAHGTAPWGQSVKHGAGRWDHQCRTGEPRHAVSRLKYHCSFRPLDWDKDTSGSLDQLRLPAVADSEALLTAQGEDIPSP